jgi:hypothetical protein
MTDPGSVVQIDVSTIGFDRWTPSGHDALLMADVDDYLNRVVEALELADRAGRVDLVLSTPAWIRPTAGFPPRT